ncbi:MAG: hypothetical protein LBL70_08750, partial [Treponema sp.]|nr:hypothetical protein [Treponema sp.]
MKRILVIGLLSIAAGLSFAQSSGDSSSPPVSADQAVPVAAPNPTPAKTAPAAKPARTSQAQSAPVQRAPVIVQPIITNPPVVNNHYYGKVYNPPAQAQTQAPTTIIIPIPVPTTPLTVPAAPAAAQSPQAVPAVSPPTAPASAGLPRRDPYTGYIIPAGPPRRTIRGVLGVERGMITLTDANEVRWFVMGLERYIGLIEGLNIGEEAEIKG